MKEPPSADVVEARLRRASELAGPLSPETRLSTKISLSPADITRRLKEASDLLDLCRTLGEHRSR